MVMVHCVLVLLCVACRGASGAAHSVSGQWLVPCKWASGAKVPGLDVLELVPGLLVAQLETSAVGQQVCCMQVCRLIRWCWHQLSPPLTGKCC
jgi:hypothetical protein